jgi:hypothetical protein
MSRIRDVSTLTNSGFNRAKLERLAYPTDTGIERIGAVDRSVGAVGLGVASASVGAVGTAAAAIGDRPECGSHEESCPRRPSK